MTGNRNHISGRSTLFSPCSDGFIYEANARLIVRAPEMYEALELAAARFELSAGLLRDADWPTT